jgi:hypothetical protein
MIWNARGVKQIRRIQRVFGYFFLLGTIFLFLKRYYLQVEQPEEGADHGKVEGQSSDC